MKKPNPPENKENESKKTKGDPVGYPLYPAKDDIYRKSKEEKDIDPEDGSLMDEDEDGRMEASDDLEMEDDIEEGELDVPGSELDDDLEDIGDEDEENNYYSIGGDKHADLDENNETEDDIII